jgi:diaminohydroxyphosphoribosylaminopyrimidine deaminase/5-amino-6-(5-phosphoribosylamino)uracil reductase
MELALDLARSREGLTGTNPSVGCVIVKNDKINFNWSNII